MNNLVSFILLVILSISCAKDPDEDLAPSNGLVGLKLDALDIVARDLSGSRATVNTDTFKVVIENEMGDMVVEYENASDIPELITLSPGNYKVKAFSENFTEAAFESPDYYGESYLFAVVANEITNVSVTCKIINCAVQILYSSNVNEQFLSFSASVSNASGILLYDETETRIGYFDLSTISIEATLEYEDVSGNVLTKTLSGSIENPEPQTIYEVNLDASTSRLAIAVVSDSQMFTEILNITDQVPAPAFGSFAPEFPTFPHDFVTSMDFNQLSASLDIAEEFVIANLSAEAQEVAANSNSGGSSVNAEILAMEILATYGTAQLLKTKTEIIMDGASPPDLLVQIEGVPVVVFVTRAIAFPIDETVSVSALTDLLNDKLADIPTTLSNLNVENLADKGILMVLSPNAATLDNLDVAIASIEPTVTQNTILFTLLTSSMDSFLYN